MTRESEDIWWNSMKVQIDTSKAPILTFLRLFNPTFRAMTVQYHKISKNVFEQNKGISNMYIFLS